MHKAFGIFGGAIASLGTWFLAHQDQVGTVANAVMQAAPGTTKVLAPVLTVVGIALALFSHPPQAPTS
jgi:hypothetical protein